MEPRISGEFDYDKSPTTFESISLTSNAHHFDDDGDGDGDDDDDEDGMTNDLHKFNDSHIWDPNLDRTTVEEIDRILTSKDQIAQKLIQNELAKDSPYAEVRAAVNNFDIDVPSNTLRAWIIALLFTTIGTTLNVLFSLRQPPLVITSIVAQLLAYPVGKLFERVLPTRQFKLGPLKWTLNPGPFNVKEHTVVTIMANATFGQGAAYATDLIQALNGFYKHDMGWLFSILYAISSQMIGFGLAGLFRRFLIFPAAMIWPAVLPNCALFYSLHKTRQKLPKSFPNNWTLSRSRWFIYVLIASFLWYWFPGWIWQSLSVFAFVTWIRPNNPLVNQLFGGYTGLSLIPITLDWTYISAYMLSPLIPPWHAIANTLIGLFLFMIILVIALHYSNVWNSHFLPISDIASYDNTGKVYNSSRILLSNFSFDLQSYRNYSPLYLSTTFAVHYGLSFAAITAVIVHTALFSSKDIWYRYKSSRNQEDDIHMKLMKKYPDVPNWWFALHFIIMFALGFGVALGWSTDLSWWAYILAVLISVVWFIPAGMLQAVTNVQFGLNVLSEFIFGYIQPGKPLAMMIFKTYGFITLQQGLIFSQNLKLAHYMKIPPLTMFWIQGVSTLWGAVLQVIVMYWAFDLIQDLCAENQPNRFSCPNGRLFYNASLIWGVIGPRRMFSKDCGTYSGLQWFWLVGAISPLIIYLFARRYPKSVVRYLNAPVILGGLSNIPPATPLNYLSWGIVGFIFNKFIRARYRAWWLKYNYITSAALDSGLLLSTIVIFFSLLLPQVQSPRWWGNHVFKSTMDYKGDAILSKLPPLQTFGPSTWC